MHMLQGLGFNCVYGISKNSWLDRTTPFSKIFVVTFPNLVSPQGTSLLVEESEEGTF